MSLLCWSLLRCTSDRLLHGGMCSREHPGAHTLGMDTLWQRAPSSVLAGATGSCTANASTHGVTRFAESCRHLSLQEPRREVWICSFQLICSGRRGLLVTFPCGMDSPNPSAAQPGLRAPAMFLSVQHHTAQRCPTKGHHFSIHEGKENKMRKAAAPEPQNTP